MSKEIWRAITRGFSVAVPLMTNEHAQEDDPEFQGIRSAACEVYAKLSTLYPNWTRGTRAAFLNDCAVRMQMDGNVIEYPVWEE